MAIHLVRGECSECEGTGHAVDYFQPPVSVFDEDFNRSRCFGIVGSCRSDGRFFGAEKCGVCQGRGRVEALVTELGGVVDLWPDMGDS